MFWYAMRSQSLNFGKEIFGCNTPKYLVKRHNGQHTSPKKSHKICRCQPGGAVGQAPAKHCCVACPKPQVEGEVGWPA